MLVIVLNGSVNSGKTTTGRALASQLPGAAFMDGDDHGIPASVPFAEMIDLAVEWVGKRIAQATVPTLVIAYPLRDQDYLKLQLAATARDARLIVVTLAPPLAVVTADRGDRRLDAWERNRVAEMYEEGYASRAYSNLIITDVTTQALAASRIVEHFHLDAKQ